MRVGLFSPTLTVGQHNPVLLAKQAATLDVERLADAWLGPASETDARSITDR